MKPAGERMVAVALAAVVLMLLQGCPSAYQRTYNQETQALEAQQRAQQAQAEAAHAQAQKYAAIIYFAVGSATIDADGQQQLNWFVQQMQPYPQAIIQVQGFADSTGAEMANLGLSMERANNVANYLAAQGIASSRMVVQGFGEQYAAASNASAQGRRNNRRVEVTVR
jgi:outer membrane protein OmpA-like peptidoglycan-associated protein